jgi:enterochelin esterase-like enzyme
MKNSSFQFKTNSSRFIKLFFICLAFTSVIQAQPRQPGPRGPVIVSPEVMPDNSVILRLFAPRATEVTVIGDWMSNPGTGENMVKNDTGLWTLTTAPLKEELYGYSFTVNGIRTIDPNNIQVLRDGRRYSSFFIIPGSRSDMYKVNDVPHGSLAKLWYNSPILGMKRRIYVYTPAGYEGSNEKYPVFYLLHGAGGDEDAWSTMGRAVQIMDNLIAQGKAKPMIVVMTNGNANQIAAANDVPSPQNQSMGGFMSNAGKFEESLVKDVVPFIDKNFRTLTDREHRAIGGLSMGGGHATYAGLNNIDQFAWVGSFSGAFVLWPNARAAQGAEGLNMDAVKTQVFPNLNSSVNADLKLLYISCGTEDFLFQVNRQFKGWLKESGIQFVDVETPGYAHVWSYWRISLIDFASQLFK